ncbi:dihydroneopterin aldolase [Roseinatronobacter alkalisoli]|uniref:dihydroneopterin aldolase n=1 Tax=Roseinatronobacter alkalisoli TaxID=3028235 RepID=A0ABT5T9G7_9RHOB|nr:dihydroneopterin aldolase [Roseinatronobacter sp. HJB301]MDD7971773.1 dihydroneopterin aldolase [Roseinatronobacter sp. HJB301]
MSSDIRLAFAHPEARAEASAPADPRDRISLRDHIVEVEIGAFQAERGQRQRVRFDIVVEVRPNPAPLEDDVDRILSYDRIADAIAAELAAERLNLLETLAERIADRILLEPQAMRAFVRVEKLDRGPGALGVEIVRNRASQPLRALDAAGQEEPVHPLVVYLDNDMIAAPGLAARLDGLQASGPPVILCVGMPPETPPAVTPRAVQRRIDLLALEQNAWRLAALDRRCVVVASRTEIDWAMKQGQMIVWAPSKLILDSTDSPDCSPRDGVALALWLAEHVAAERLLVPEGMLIPPGSHVPQGRLPA